jgi:E3 ubiquitin-protein ligase HUWE1
VKEDPPAFTIAAPTRADPNNVKELVPDGANVFVNEHNRGEYVDLYAQQCMLRCSTAPCNSTFNVPPPSTSSLSSPFHESDTAESNQDISFNLAAFTSGFDEVVPRELVSSWECDDLELLVCGLQDINVAAWEQATTYEPKTSSNSATPGVTTETRSRWFWEAVKSMNSEQKHALLHFWTAFRKLPHTGFRGLRFKIRFDDQKSSKHLPMAQTCFLTLRVPKYASYEETREKLVTAISECCFGFGFS